MSRVHGDAFEELLNLQHGQYHGRGSAEIFRNEIAGAWKFNKRESKRVFIPLPRSRPDYAGVITAAPWAIPVHFDAKTTKNLTRWTLNRDSMHQYEMLHNLAGKNALCFFLIEFRELNKFVILRVAPWLRPFDWRPTIQIQDVKKVSEMFTSIGELEMTGFTPAYPQRDWHLVHESFEFQAKDGGLCDWLAALKITWLNSVTC